MIYLRACFRELNSNFRRTKGFILKLSNMAKSKYDGNNLRTAFQYIKNYAGSKVKSHTSKKTFAAQTTFSCLHQLYLKKMLNYYSEIRVKAYSDKKKETRQITMIAHIFGRSVKRAFQRWKF